MLQVRAQDKTLLCSRHGMNVFLEKQNWSMRSATKNPAQPLFYVEDSNETAGLGISLVRFVLLVRHPSIQFKQPTHIDVNTPDYPLTEDGYRMRENGTRRENL
jgi:hypothetical protein